MVKRSQRTTTVGANTSNHVQVEPILQTCTGSFTQGRNLDYAIFLTCLINGCKHKAKTCTQQMILLNHLTRHLQNKSFDYEN